MNEKKTADKNHFDGYALFHNGVSYPIDKSKFEWYSKVLNQWEEISHEEFNHMQAKGMNKSLRITSKEMKVESIDNWRTDDPKINGKYLVKVLMCDNPYNEAEQIDEFKNGYWIGYAQFVLAWKPIPKYLQEYAGQETAAIREENERLLQKLNQAKYDNENAWKGVKQVCAEKYKISEENERLKEAVKDMIPLADGYCTYLSGVLDYIPNDIDGKYELENAKAITENAKKLIKVDSLKQNQQ